MSQNKSNSAIITVIKPKYQVTIPSKIRNMLNINIGDHLTVNIKNNQIILTPSSVIEHNKLNISQDLIYKTTDHRDLTEIHENIKLNETINLIKHTRLKSEAIYTKLLRS